MILNKSKSNKVERNFKGNGQDMTIDTSNMATLMHFLSAGLYSNPIGSVVREYSSNAWDSHIEAKVNKPITVSVNSDTQGKFFSVEDYGMGLSPDRVEKVFGKYLSSTKRDTNEQLGAFGLGSKSALAYTDTFYITTRYNGIEYGYAMYKTEEFTRLEKLYDVPTKEENGTLIKIYLINDYDSVKFKEECKKQLLYFKNIDFDFNGISLDYKIFEGDGFLYSDLESHCDLHAVLGNVAYPLDFNQLGISHINIPFGLKFKVGDFSVTPSREAIHYTPQTKNLILNKIKEVASELMSNYNTQIHTFDSFIDFVRTYKRNYTNLKIGKNIINISDIKKFTDIKPVAPKIKELGDLNCKNFDINSLTNDIKLVGRIDYDGKSCRIGKHESINTFDFLKKEPSYIILDDKKSLTKNKYIAYIQDYETSLIRDDFEMNNYKATQICDMFGINKESSQQEKNKAIGLFLRARKNLINSFEKYSKIEIDEEWLELQKSKRLRAKREKGSIKIGILNYKTGYGYKERKGWSVEYSDFKIDEIAEHFSEGKIIYDTKENRHKLEQLGNIGQNIWNTNFTLVIIAKSYIKHLSSLENSYTIDEFIYQPYQIYKDYATYKAVSDILEDIWGYKVLDIDNALDTDFYESYKSISKYKTTSIPQLLRILIDNYCDKNKLQDQKIIDESLEFREKINKFDFLKYFNLNQKGVKKVIKDYMKCKNIEIN